MKRAILFICLLWWLAACQQPDETVPTVPTQAMEVLAETAVPTRIVVDEGSAIAEEAAAPTAVPEPTTEPTLTVEPTPLPGTELVVCMGKEPTSLYLYGDSSLPATAVRHALYENLYTSLSYGYQPQALEKMPSLADGDAFFQEVTARENDWVMNAAGRLVRLVEREQVVDASGKTVTFKEGNEVVMQQLVVDFAVKPLVWSDGTAVTAADYLLGFTVASDPDTPNNKTITERTASYEAIDDTHLRWSGIPGYLDITYFSNIWPPLPSHQLQGMTPRQLLDAPEVAQMPLSTGPFVVEEWLPGSEIRLGRNPHYYRASEGLPKLGRLIFRFGTDGATILQDPALGGCDVVTQDVFGQEQLTAVGGDPTPAQQAGAVFHIQPSPIYEHIAFGIDSVFTDDFRRPDWFEDKRVRQAITMCTNRQQMIDELTGGYGEMMHAYIPNQHPLYPADLPEWDYDPVAANALLDEAKLLDLDGDGRRQELSSGTTFTITIGTNNESGLRQQINNIFQENMRDCGIVVETYTRSAGTWFGDGPGGPVFGRRFDLAEFGWLSRVQPNCDLYLSENVTGPESIGLGGWSNVNVTGWRNEAFDTACRAARAALPGTPDYDSNHQAALRIFADELPAMPLFTRIELAVAQPTVQNIQLNTTQPSELWNVFEWDIEE